MNSPDLRDMQAAQAEWISGLLPDRDVRRTVIKLSSEVSELLESVIVGPREAVAGEVADCLILLTDIAELTGVNIVDAFYDKLEVNRQRRWVESGGSLQHTSKE